MKQSTLFKHIQGVPAPPKEQPSLDQMWATKKEEKGVESTKVKKEGTFVYVGFVCGKNDFVDG